MADRTAPNLARQDKSDPGRKQHAANGQIVSNHTALRILAAIDRRLKQVALAEDSGDHVLTVEYSTELRKRLDRSGLAQMIAAGPDSLPDIYAAMNPWLRSLTVLNKPHNHTQLVLHVLDFLDWYLDQSQPVPIPVRWLPGLLNATFAIPLLPIAVLLIVASYMNTAVAGWEVLIFFLVVPIWILLAHWQLRGGQRSLHYILQVKALRRYLRDSYIEAPE